MIFKIFVQIIFIVLIFSANCEHACCEIFGNIQSRVELVSGLSDRGLFESAEILYLSESKKTDLAHKDKYALASSIVYSRMLQILTATGSERSKLITQLAAFESEFQNNIKKLQSEQSPANSITAEDLELVRLQFRFAVTWYLIGRRLLLESEIADDSNAAKLKTDAQKILLSANTELKKINSYLAAQQNSNLSDQINFLSDNINLYIYLSEIFHTFTTPADNIRNDKLTGLIVSFDNWAKDKLKFYSGKLNLSESSAQLNVYQVLRDCYYLSIRALVEVSLCYRLSGELEKALNIFLAHELKFSDSELPENLRLRIAAERLRFLAASANNVTINNRIAAVANRSIWDTNELLRFRVILSTDGLEYCLAKIEWSSFLARRLNISEAATERMVVKDILTLARQTESKIPSCGYCAAAIIGANDNIATETNNSKLHTIRAIILSELAQDRRERNQIEDAINLFELSGRVSERAGDTTTAIKNAQYAVSLLYDLLNQLEISRQNAAQDITINETMERELEFEIFGYRERVMKLLCGVSRRLVGERDSIELYKRGIDEATILFKAKRLNVDEYILVLSDYWSNWGEASDCDVYKLRVANLLEFNGRFEEALVFLAMIPNDSRQGLDTVLAADRCFKQIHFRNKNKNKNEYKEENINENINGNNNGLEINVIKNELSWFKRRLRVDVLGWTAADAETVIKLSERIFYWRGFPLFYWELVEGELLRDLESDLNMTINRCKSIKPVTIARLRMMLIIANNLRGNHVKSKELIKQINTDQVGLLTELESLFLRRFGVEVLVMSGDVVGALSELDNMLRVDARNLMLLELKAEILMRQDDNLSLSESSKIWGLIGMIAKEKSDQWWNAREKIINIFIKQGNHAEAQKTYKRLKFLHPNLGNKSRKERLEKLMNENSQI